MDLKVDPTELVRWAAGAKSRVPRVTRAAVARALNQLGDSLVDEAKNAYAEARGVTRFEIEPYMRVRRATSANLWWELRANLPPSMQRRRDWRSLKRDRMGRWLSSENALDFSARKLPEIPPGTFVNVITAGDHYSGVRRRLVEVCDICQDIAENEEGGKNVYTIEEVMAKAKAGWGEYSAAEWVQKQYDWAIKQAREGKEITAFTVQTGGYTHLFHHNCRCTIAVITKRWEQVAAQTRKRNPPLPRAGEEPFQVEEGVATTAEDTITFKEFAERARRGSEALRIALARSLSRDL